MNRKTLALAFIFIAVGIAIGIIINRANREEVAEDTTPAPTSNITKQNCIADECLSDDVDFPVGKLTANIEGSLIKGLDDEYKAYATYKAAMDTYGDIRPFVMIARAELQHIASLQALFEKYGMQIPENSYIGNIAVPGTIQSACATGVQAEIDNVELYKKTLLPKVINYPDITLVFTNLMNASEQKHLPAFQRCD